LTARRFVFHLCRFGWPPKLAGPNRLAYGHFGLIDAEAALYTSWQRRRDLAEAWRASLNGLIALALSHRVRAQSQVLDRADGVPSPPHGRIQLVAVATGLPPQATVRGYALKSVEPERLPQDGGRRYGGAPSSTSTISGGTPKRTG
jgi:hypothetical protein